MNLTLQQNMCIYVCVFDLVAGSDGSQDVGQSSKHMLTPESKSTVESVPKRFAAMSCHCMSYMYINYLS